MIFKNTKLQKIISFLIIVAVLAPSVFIFSTPKKVEAQGTPVADFFSAALEFVGNVFTGSSAVSDGTVAAKTVTDWALLVLQEVLRAVARKALQEITKSTVAWINNGFHGSPLFLENSGSFFQDIAKSEIKTLVDRYGYDELKFPFGKDFALNTIKTYKRTLETNSAYTLSTVIKDPAQLRAYQNDFNTGGWNGFLVNTQYPQNNYLGFQLQATDELARRVAGTAQTPVTAIKKTLEQGNGFLSPQVCETNQGYNNMVNEFQKPVFDEAKFRKDNDIWKDGPPTQAQYDKWRADHDKAVADFNSPTNPNNCPPRKDGSSGFKTVTPGYVVGNQITKALGATQDETTLAGQAGNALSLILGAVIDKFLQDGLTALESEINPQPQKDTWTYGGIGLDSDGNANNDPFAGFDEVIVLRDFKILLFGKTVRVLKEGDLLFDGKGKPVLELIIRPEGTTSEQKIADGGEIVTEIGDTRRINSTQGTPLLGTCLSNAGNDTGVTKNDCDSRNGNWKDIDGREYFAGDIARTMEEIFLMDSSKIGGVGGSASTINPMGTCRGTDQIGSYNYQTTEINCPATGTWTRGSAIGVGNSGISASGNSDFGILQLLKLIPTQTRELDRCVPGPDKGWEDRLKSEQARVMKDLTAETNSDDGLKARAATDATRELKFAVDAFKDWINLAMLTSPNPPELPDLSLPSSIIYIDEIKKIDDLPQTSKEVTDAVRDKRQTLARLQVMGNALNTMTTNLANNKKADGVTPDPLEEPRPNTGQEKLLIQYWKQYRTLQASISSNFSLENTRSQQTTLNEWSTNLEITLIPECLAERNAKQWETPDTTGKGGAKLKPLADEAKVISIWRIFSSREGNNTASVIGMLTGGIVGSILGGLFGTEEIVDVNAEVKYTIKGTEIEQFCGLPIINGYSHGEVIREDSSNELLATNPASGYTTSGDGDCNPDDTGELDPETGEPLPPNPISGYCGFDDEGNPIANPVSGTDINGFIGTGREKFTFRNQAASTDLPNAEQYAFGTNGYTTVPMVNAQYIYGDITTTGVASWGIGLGSSEDERVSIDISCDTIFKANITDYTHAGDPSF